MKKKFLILLHQNCIGSEAHPTWKREFLNQQQITLLDAFSSGKILNQVDRNDLTLSAGAQEILELHEQNATLKSEHKKLRMPWIILSQRSHAAPRQPKLENHFAIPARFD
ncbi:MAG: hypothetical protein R3F36_07935 [Candidatus Competibacteraceae bacterium]